MNKEHKAETGERISARVGGYDLRFLDRGVRYVASRPFAQRYVRQYPVSISKADTGALVCVVDLMSYEKANRFLAAFNNGNFGFEGRVWEGAQKIESNTVRFHLR